MRYYVTTPIYYVNARPHLGHAYTTILNDTLTRFHRLKGDDSRFLTGTDEHGDKIVRAAEREGSSPREYVDRMSAMFREAWPRLDVETSDFIRTTEERHKTVVRRFLDLVNSKGDIYFGEYGGHYCFGCERFYTDKELVDGLCPDHQTKPEWISESNYFFKMGAYQDWLVDHIKSDPDFIRPEGYKSEVLGFLRDPLEDLCITRPKSRLTWGIDVPFDDRFVTYVWFDALINYISALGWPDGELYGRYWPVAEHTIAKDILKPHAIFWPTMLKSAGLPIYRHLNVHGYWRIGRSKMSKSVGNVVEALSMAERYGNDTFRYFLMREMTLGLDSEFSEDRLVERHDSDLANDLGNLWRRALAMVERFHDSKVPIGALGDAGQADDAEWAGREERLVAGYVKAFEDFNPRQALIIAWEHVSALNKAIDTEAPWALAKDESKRGRLLAVLARLLKGLALLGALVWPVMPKTAETMWRRLGLEPAEMTLDLAVIARKLAHPRPLVPGEPLFPRIETSGSKPAKAKAEAKPEPKAEAKDQAGAKAEPKPEARKPAAGPAEVVTIDELKRLDLRVATVLEARMAPKSRKLIELKVSLGDSQRTIVAGVGAHYRPEDLVGRRVVIVANLAPAKLMGIESQGMVLAAVVRDEASTSGERLTLLTTDGEIDPGAKVS